jgi:HAE1 family hydrophobic/amphiphilic exporter-1/multidrug efflux pump
MGQLIQMDNVVTIEEKSNPPQLYHNNRYMAATNLQVLLQAKVCDGIDAMNES